MIYKGEQMTIYEQIKQYEEVENNLRSNIIDYLNSQNKSLLFTFIFDNEEEVLVTSIQEGMISTEHGDGLAYEFDELSTKELIRLYDEVYNS